MSQANPYAPATEAPIEDAGIRKVNVRPIDLFKRSYALLGDKYWLFLGIVLVGVLVGSAVPFGVIMGAMMVGIYLCFIHRERGWPVEFGTLFKGFDYFLESFIAILIYMGVAFLVMIPLVIVFLVVVIAPLAMAQADGGGGEPPAEFFIGILVMYPLMLLASLLVMLPFTFTFQLIADRNMKAIPAVKSSLRGVMKNFAGVLWFYIVVGILSIILSLMCYVPALLFMPINFGALYLLYRDIYPHAAPAGPLSP